MAVFTVNGAAVQVNKNQKLLRYLRDGLHLTFNVGRYIAALTFAETVVPQKLRQKSYVLPNIRASEAIGSLPKEYTTIAQACVSAAMKSYRSGDLSVTNIKGYETDPAVKAMNTLNSAKLGTAYSSSASAQTTGAQKAIQSVLPDGVKIEKITPPSSPVRGKKNAFEVKIRFGYTTRTLTVYITLE